MEFLIHQGHLRIENCKKCAIQSLFWPLMNSEIEDLTKKCPTCLTFRNRQPSEPKDLLLPQMTALARTTS